MTLTTATLQLESRHAVPITVGGSFVTLTVFAGDPVYYGNDNQVSAANNLGTIALGQSLTPVDDVWVRSSGFSALTLQIAPGPDSTPARNGNWTPADLGMIAWAFDPASQTSGQGITTGQLNLVGLLIPGGTPPISQLLLKLSTAGSGLTANQNFAALYQNGVLLGVSGDQAAAWSSSGLKQMPLATPVQPAPGFAYVGFWANGTTAPQPSRGNNDVLINGLLPVAASRYATANTGLTTTAPPTLGALSVATSAFWAGVA